MSEAGPAARAGRLSWAVFGLARAHRGRAARLLRDLGLHPGQELLLMLLLERDGRTQSELLDLVGLDASTVSKALRRMEDAGLLARTTAAHDRRVHVVRLTDRGRALGPALDAMWDDLERASVRDLSPAEVEELIRLAGVVQRSVTGAPADHDRAAPRHRGAVHDPAAPHDHDPAHDDTPPDPTDERH